jgi:hypothetical protein
VRGRGLVVKNMGHPPRQALAHVGDRELGSLLLHQLEQCLPALRGVEPLRELVKTRLLLIDTDTTTSVQALDARRLGVSSDDHLPQQAGTWALRAPGTTEVALWMTMRCSI